MRLIGAPAKMNCAGVGVVVLAFVVSVTTDGEVTPECAKELSNLFLQRLSLSNLPFSEPTVATRKAAFGMSCFWGAEAVFGALPGVIRVKAGYTGGQSDDPTYTNLGDHTEAVEVDYDPTKTTFSDLLRVFWENQDTTEPDILQYMSAIFYHDDTQRELAEESKRNHLDQTFGGRMSTRIQLAGTFYNAEDYHQKYFLRQHKNLVESLGLRDSDFLSSHRTSRLLGYIMGNRHDSNLEDEKDQLALTDEQLRYIREVRASNTEGSCAANANKDEL